MSENPTDPTATPPTQTQTRFEAEAALRAYADVPAEVRPEVVASFLEEVDRRVVQRAQAPVPASVPGAGRGQSLALAITSLVLAIPLSAIAGNYAGFRGVLAAWAVVLIVNVIFNNAGHRRA